MGSHEKAPSSPKKSSGPSRSSSTSSKQTVQQGLESWEVLDNSIRESGLEPGRHEGLLLKKRKWPLKGWHKRYFVLEDGVLRYGASRQDVTKGKLHGCIDIRLSVMSINKKAQRIDLDTEDNLYHLKVKSQELFQTWVAKLCSHRLMQRPDTLWIPESRVTPGQVPLSDWSNHGFSRWNIPPAPALSGAKEKVAVWLKDRDDLDRCSTELFDCQRKLLELSHLLQNLEGLHRIPSAPVISVSHSQFSMTDKPKKGKRSTKIWCTQSFAKDDTIGRVGRLHGSVPNLSRYLDSNHTPAAFSAPPEYAQLQKNFWSLAQTVHGSLGGVVSALTSERDRLREMRQELELLQRLSSMHTGSGVNSTSEVILEVTDPQERHRRMHTVSISSDTTVESFASLNHEPDSLSPDKQELEPQLSNQSSVSLSDSHTEFFDACEVFLSASSSENEVSDDESCISEAVHSLSGDGPVIGASTLAQKETTAVSLPVGIPRRSSLPAPSVHSSDVSLWNILRNNIGKDLSKVSMPVQLNEPLNTLQRLCEELEYSALLDMASQSQDPCERMVCIAAFAVSAYASTYHRAGSKPFNPVLGETYESDRPDKGFRFISEQVSHHPAVSACHAESDNYVFWQDMKWKNKFWGKSLEIVPVGTINVKLPRFGDHYEWNKVTSCIHNILSGQRWIEHYGEVLIRNTQDSSYHCKLTFCKGRYWSSTVNEVQGVVVNQRGAVIHRLHGTWSEGLHCGEAPNTKCIWKPNCMPRDYEKYYGFTQFALELNELTADLKPFLPATDSRLRPDQRYLEEGNVQAAEAQKRRIEQLQRDRRKVMEENNIQHQPRFFRRVVDGSKEAWESNHTYWELRKQPGFAKLDCAVLW
ncbi:oxysterol-binding protein-related protein 7 [Lissotriton helveticus]